MLAVFLNFEILAKFVSDEEVNISTDSAYHILSLLGLVRLSKISCP